MVLRYIYIYPKFLEKIVFTFHFYPSWKLLPLAIGLAITRLRRLPGRKKPFAKILPFPRILGILLAILFCAASFAQPTIIVLGDSLSAGYGIPAEKGWVNLLQQRLQNQTPSYQVINASISGDTTSGGLSRLPQTLKEHNPNIVIVELGGNDGLRALPLFVIKRNLNEIIQQIQEHGAQPIILGVRLPPNYGPDYTEKFQEIFAEVAKDNDVPIVPSFLKKVDENHALMQADGIHPTAEAQAIMLNNVWPVLQPLVS